MFRKEWRLVLRDPMLISQTLLQLIYLIPMFLAFFGSSSRSNPSGLNLQTIGTYPLLVEDFNSTCIAFVAAVTGENCHWYNSFYN